MKAGWPVLFVVLLSCQAGWAQAPEAMPSAASSNALTQAPGPGGIPLGSTELPTPGESPVILRLGGTLITGRGPAGTSGIALGSTELRNPGLSVAPQMANANDCTNLRGSRIAASTAAGTLPPRLFDGRGGMASQSMETLQSSGKGLISSSGCMSYGLGSTQQGIVTPQISRQAAGRAGILGGATELTNGGLSGSIAATPVSPAAPPAGEQ
jgi:hypothetical protein